MSTDLHLICDQHNARSEEVGRASGSDLARVRDYVEHRKTYRDIWTPAQEKFELEWSDIHWLPTSRTALIFIVQHAECDIQIVDEYGKYYDLSVEPEECYAWITLGDLKLLCDRDQADGHQRHIHTASDDRGVEFTVTWNAWREKKD